MMDFNKLIDGFKRQFATEHERMFFAPGRINLIGEHIDYSGGYVFPCAITYGTYAVVSKRDDRKIRVYSENFESLGIIEFDIDDLSYKKEHDWANYPKGVLSILKEKGHTLPTGLNVYFLGNIPNGAGLSSSASIEMVMAWMVNQMFDFNLTMIDCALIGKQTENEYIGVNSGIMDQFAIGMGQKDQAILLNTETLDYTMIPVELGDHKIVIMNTNKRRGLADSKYNERRSECETALELIQTVKPIHQLCDLTMAQFEEVKHVLTDDVLYRRAHHAVSENERTQEATKVLQQGDLQAFGALMNASHRSLRDDYEVTGFELDTLAELAWSQESTIGARVTGAGFGGCAIAIVQSDKVTEFIDFVAVNYRERVGYDASFYVAQVGDGVHEIV